MTFNRIAPGAVSEPDGLLSPAPQNSVGRLPAKSGRRRSNDTRRRRFDRRLDGRLVEDAFLIEAGRAWLDAYFPTDRVPSA